MYLEDTRKKQGSTLENSNEIKNNTSDKVVNKHLKNNINNKQNMNYNKENISDNE